MAYFTDPMSSEFKKAMEEALKDADLDQEDVDGDQGLEKDTDGAASSESSEVSNSKPKRRKSPKHVSKRVAKKGSSAKKNRLSRKVRKELR
jgi:hypothetical protein